MKKLISLLLFAAILSGTVSGCGQEKAYWPNASQYSVSKEPGILVNAESTQEIIQTSLQPSQPVIISGDSGETTEFPMIAGLAEVPNPENPEQTLTISVPSGSGFLEYAANKYREKNKGIAIVINSYEPQYNDSMSREQAQAASSEALTKYAQTINTSLMSGKADDIIDVSTLSWATLADAGHLLDLKPVLGLSSDGYYGNIMNTYSYKGGQYTVPFSFIFTGFRYDKSIAQTESGDITLDKLVELVNKYPGSPIFSETTNSGGSPFGLIEMLVEMDYNKYVDLSAKEAHFDDGRFQALLEKVNSIKDNVRVADAGETPLIWEYTVYGPAMTNAGTIDYTGMYLLTNDEGKASYETNGILPAINKNSKNADLAADFLKFMLSDEIQSSPELLYSPVNKKVSAQKAAEMVAGTEPMYIPEGYDLDANIAMFDKLADKLGVVENSDRAVRQFVRDAIASFLDGQANAGQAAATLQATVNTYLKE